MRTWRRATTSDSLKDIWRHGIFGGQVSSRKMPQGNDRKATEQYIELLLETVEKPPKELGYEFGRWTGSRLSTYLEQQTGIKLSSK